MAKFYVHSNKTCLKEKLRKDYVDILHSAVSAHVHIRFSGPTLHGVMRELLLGISIGIKFKFEFKYRYQQ